MHIPWIRGLFMLLSCAVAGQAADRLELQLKPAGTQASLSLHSRVKHPLSGMYSEYTIQRSTDMTTWETLGTPVTGGIGLADELLNSFVSLTNHQAFYRVQATVKQAPADQSVGDSIYGYGTEFSRQLQQVGQLSLSNFCQTYAPTNLYLPQITFDPTVAEYWAQYSTSLASNEFAIFQTNGFVVSGRLGSYSFGDAFYRIFSSDLPVYFSCDAALQAWHRSFDAMLEELEEAYMSPTLLTVVEGMQNQLYTLDPNIGDEIFMEELNIPNAMTPGMLDADFFLAVAKSLVTGTNNSGKFLQGDRVQSALNAISSLQPQWINLFGANRLVDFTQFTVRGHYEKSECLRRYFRAVMWCGLADFRFTGSTGDNSLRELSGAVTLHLLLQRSGQFTNWQQMDRVIQTFVGSPDSLSFAQLNDLMAAANITARSQLYAASDLANLQSRLMSGQLGVQEIQSGLFYSPLGAEQLTLPRSFTVLGQRFVPDSWALGQTVYDRILWDGAKVMRRVPSALDVAFSVLANDQTVPLIAARIAAGSHPWRDARPYQHNLAAVRRVIDAQNPAAWTNTIYGCWLACLRELSTPTTGSEYPDAMRTPAWAMKTLNAQLASWTQLRHDTVLYAKQPYSAFSTCSYPDGFVEPRVAFWDRMRDMALRTRQLLDTLPTNGNCTLKIPDDAGTSQTFSLAELQANRLQFLDNFAEKMGVLKEISAKELARQTLATNDVEFLKNLIEDHRTYTGVRKFGGWYPQLFYRNIRAAYSLETPTPCDLWDSLVVDVFTDPWDPSTGDPGCILHEGVGMVPLLIMAVNWGPGDMAIYAGPVFSHYEFELGPTTRKTDSQWKAEVRAGSLPPQPEWTQSFLVPGMGVPPPSSQW